MVIFFMHSFRAQLLKKWFLVGRLVGCYPSGKTNIKKNKDSKNLNNKYLKHIYTRKEKEIREKKTSNIGYQIWLMKSLQMKSAFAKNSTQLFWDDNMTLNVCCKITETLLLCCTCAYYRLRITRNRLAITRYTTC